MLRRKIGEFYLTELLGSGGMADVYLGISPRTREKRAIKILAKRATSSSTTYARFLREIEIIRSLRHPRVVRILDSGILDECYYYVMEYMSGGSLSRRLGGRRIDLQEAISLMVYVCDAMAYAHERGIIHRDLKPANILLAADGIPMLSDFGIAKVLDDGRTTLTRSNEILGTIAYLAPEQRFDTKQVDRRADVYALGAILYEMLMGFPPLGNFPWPSDTRADFPAAIESILRKCLALSPQDRYLHAGPLLSDLQQYQRAENTVGAQEGDTDQSPPETAPFCHPKLDRLDAWFQTLRSGTTRERLAVVREMVEKIEPREASAILKLFPGEGDRVRWGLIRVLGEMQIAAATPMLINELNSPFHRECAVEALGRIGSDEAFKPILEYIEENPHSAVMALLPLARTGKERAIVHLRKYLPHDLAVVRQAAVRGLSAIRSTGVLQILKDRLPLEHDERVRSVIVQSIHALEGFLRQPLEKSRMSTEILQRAKPA
ncbi:MAG TPA: protein kinase [Acidobacteriota bacterium]|nr:protein kinase [Acidobacteriota bacterium]